MDYNDLKTGVDGSYWYFAGKSDMLKRLANRHLQTGGGLKILNIGCGTGDDILVLRQFGTVFGVEYSYDTIKNCLLPRGFGTVTRSDAQALNFKDSVFDCVVMLDVLEHLGDDFSAMKEVSRVLKNDGVAIISVPAHQFLWSGHDAALGHVRRYSRSCLKRLFDANFSIKRLTFWNTLMFFPVAAARMFRRFIRSEGDKPDVAPMAGSVNALLRLLLFSENKVLEYIDSPVGISLFGVVVKKKED